MARTSLPDKSGIDQGGTPVGSARGHLRAVEGIPRQAGPEGREHLASKHSEAGAAGLLENYANNFSPPNSCKHPASTLTEPPRRARYARRGVLWDLSSLERIRKCGRVSHLPGGSVAVRLTEGVAGFAGLTSCGSVWADPVCNAKVMSRRAVEIGAAVALWQSQGGAVAFATFTMRHHSWQRLATLWDALSKAWHSVTAGKQWVKDQQRHDVAGFLRMVEVTQGRRNGWHVHVHALLFLEDEPEPAALAQLHDRMVGRWTRRLVALEMPAPLPAGQECHLVQDGADADLAAYFTKATDSAHRIGLEVTHTQSKTARGAYKTGPTWDLLDQVVATGEVEAVERWHEWEAASKGRKQMTWSKGIRDRLGLLREASDEEIAEEEHGSAADDLVLIDSEGWATLRSRPRDLADLLTLAEIGGLGYVRQFLDIRGVSYALVDQ